LTFHVPSGECIALLQDLYTAAGRTFQHRLQLERNEITRDDFLFLCGDNTIDADAPSTRRFSSFEKRYAMPDFSKSRTPHRAPSVRSPGRAPQRTPLS
jgi:hypothetical protein